MCICTGWCVRVLGGVYVYWVVYASCFITFFHACNNPLPPIHTSTHHSFTPPPTLIHTTTPLIPPPHPPTTHTHTHSLTPPLHSHSLLFEQQSVDNTGSPLVAKITDFGMARVRAAANNTTNIDTRKGTVAWQPPGVFLVCDWCGCHGCVHTTSTHPPPLSFHTTTTPSHFTQRHSSQRCAPSNQMYTVLQWYCMKWQLEKHRFMT